MEMKAPFDGLLVGLINFPILQPRRGIARCMLSSVHLQFDKNDQNNKTNVNNTVCIASQKNIYCLYPPHSTSVNKEVNDDFGGNCNGVKQVMRNMLTRKYSELNLNAMLKF